MLIKSTPALHYPITVTELLRKQDDEVERFAPLFSYVYQTKVTEGDKYGDVFETVKDMPATFESETEGTISKWNIKVGSVITGSGTNLLEIEEPCAHDVQFGGMCATCGKDMTEVNYATSRLDSARAPIAMTHGNTALTVSTQEAARLEDENKRRLLSTKRLSLVVDLDQTVIHATVDPTVAEWQKDTDNPNHAAVKNVKAFQLLDDGPGARDTWYYIKLRPGLEEFLENISRLYELHIYTMGTRAYAENVAKIVDPERKYFGDRILSRNESGSLTVKTLRRLFPIDTKMVVIIDDRGDVWHWSPNLVKVKPYDFFVGIGDINSSFLPKRVELPPTPPASPPPPAASTNESETAEAEVKDDGDGDGDDNEEKAEKAENGTVDPPEVVPDPVEPSTASNGTVSAIQESLAEIADTTSNPRILQERSTEQDETIAAQITDRPLLKKQMMLDKADEEAAEKEQNGDTQSDENGENTRPKHNLLHDEDALLEDLETSLRQIHRAWFEEYERRLASTQGGRVAELRGAGKKGKICPDELVPDVKDIITPMKLRVFGGVTIVFSGIVPLGVNIHYADIAIWAKTFGAQVSEHISKRTTHVVASRQRRTAKVRQAARHPGINIVTIDWLYECMSQFAKLDEKPFRIEVEPDERKQDDGQSVPSFDDLNHNAALSSSEDDDANATDMGTNDSDAEDDIAPTSTDDAALLNNITNNITDAWDQMDAEMDEFLAETDDNESDNSNSESERSEASTQSRPRSQRKRKRVSLSGGDATDGDESDESAATGGTGSRLQKRRKQVMARTTSLSNVTVAAGLAAADKSSGLPSPENTGTDDEKQVAAAARENRVGAEDAKDGEGEGEGEVEDAAEDEDADALEAEMMAELERDGDDGEDEGD